MTRCCNYQQYRLIEARPRLSMYWWRMASKHSYPTGLKIKQMQSTREKKMIKVMSKDGRTTLKFANIPRRTSDWRMGSQMYNWLCYQPCCIFNNSISVRKQWLYFQQYLVTFILPFWLTRFMNPYFILGHRCLIFFTCPQKFPKKQLWPDCIVSVQNPEESEKFPIAIPQIFLSTNTT